MIGVHGIGTYFPAEVRTNAWWPAELVAGWMDARAKRPPPPLAADASAGVRRVAKAMAEQAHDPFQGTRERRVAAASETIADMEEQAARSALARAGTDPSAIDLLLVHTVVPDVLLSNPAAVLHRRLGLGSACLALQADGAAYSFLAQLAVAEAMIVSGRAKVALLVQSCVATRLIDREDPGSVLVGDGAAAVVLGQVSGDRGFLGAVHYTDGRFPNSLVMSVPGGTWMDAGRARMHVADPLQMRDVFLSTADVCKQSVDDLLAKIGLAVSDIGYLCVYQGTAWLRRVVHDYLGIGEVRSVETFSRYGYLSAAMIPVNLAAAEAEGELHDDALVVLTGGGTGMTYGAAALRWGR